MKLINKLDREIKSYTLNYFKKYKQDVNVLDDFLADLGFKLLPSYILFQWRYKYDDNDEISIWYGDKYNKWYLEYFPQDHNTVIKRSFKSIADLINFLKQV